MLEKPGTLTTGTTILQGPMMLLTTGAALARGIFIGSFRIAVLFTTLQTSKRYLPLK